jgi:hypothetical protein
MEHTGTIRLIMARPTGGVKGGAEVATSPGGAEGSGDTEGAEGTDGTGCAGGAGGGLPPEMTSPTLGLVGTLGSVRLYSPDHLFQGILGRGREV